MNDFVFEVCEQKQYAKTFQIMKRKFAKCDLSPKLENFITFKKERSKVERFKPTSKLSFEVRYIQLIILFQTDLIIQINIDDEDTKICIVNSGEIFKELG